MRFGSMLGAASFWIVLSGAISCQPPLQPAVVAPVAVAAPKPAIEGGLPDAPLPFDARVRKGKLPNGLTYYVLAHKKPEHRAQVWLAVNAGSVLEDDDQRGLAHFVEHMGFNGTTRFPKQALVEMLEKSGIAFGADLNAHTSFDETVYTLQVPTDKPELLNRAVGVLRDWSDSVTFDPIEVDKERGVVLEEWRLGRGAGMRLFDKQAPVVFHGSKYADRITIGKPEIIKGASRDTLVRFYKDWYRPDLMAVIAVGDFDADAMVTQIKSEFATLKPATTPRPRPAVQVAPHEDTLVTIETDPEATSTSVSMMIEMPKRDLLTTRDSRRLGAETLFSMMLNARLDELRRQPNAPFLFAGAGVGHLVRTADVFSLGAVVKQGSVQ
jgi:zinc protease